MRIRKLSPHIVQQIAAGEVIERPASVLKELLENSIDASATQIKVQTEGAGLLELRVSDDGVGISEDDLPLVFEPHATSKLEKIQDFDALTSMGFRGEAMSVIAHVADVEIWTCAKAEKTGWRARQSFGQWKGVEPADARQGTEVRVSHLFQNLPVRQKFLKSTAAESRRLLTVFKRYALAYPEIAWSFEDVDRKRKLLAPPSSLQDRVLWFYEGGSAEHWWMTEGREGPWSLQAVCLKPRYLRASRQGLQLYLNRRPIQDRQLEFAVRRALEGYTENPQWAMGALYLEGPPSDFDVNVHPTKTEVRFVDSQQVFSLIVHAFREELERMHRQDLNPQLWTSKKEETHPQRTFSTVPGLKSASGQPTVFESEGRRSAPETPGRPWPVEAVISQQAKSHQTSAEQAVSSGSHLSTQGSFETALSPLQKAGALFADKAPSYQYLGSVDATYLVAKREEQLFLFDQHALHERVLYEELWAVYKEKKKLSSQRLLFPQKLQFNGVEDLLEKEQELEALGFELREWGEGAVQLLAQPSIFKKRADEALPQLLQVMTRGKESMLRELLATIACHAAIRAHDVVEPQEAQKILDRFASEDALGHCPHGRPTFICLSASELEKFFHRT